MFNKICTYFPSMYTCWHLLCAKPCYGCWGYNSEVRVPMLIKQITKEMILSKENSDVQMTESYFRLLAQRRPLTG